MRETILDVLDGSSEGRRILVVMRHLAGGSSDLVLRHESWSEDVGWFAQGSVELTPHQVAGLRAALGSVPVGKTLPRASVAATHGNVPHGNVSHGPQLISFPAHRAG